MSEEKMRILKMVQEGKISPEEGAQLLEAVGSSKESQPSPHGGGEFLRIRVRESDGTKVNVNLPLSLIKLALQFIPQEAKAQLDEKGIDINQIVRMVQEGVRGPLVEVKEEGGDEVEITVD